MSCVSVHVGVSGPGMWTVTVYVDDRYEDSWTVFKRLSRADKEALWRRYASRKTIDPRLMDGFVEVRR